jgi:uncharacterized protein YdhG (YjbR/CyaY superfamily)
VITITDRFTNFGALENELREQCTRVKFRYDRTVPMRCQRLTAQEYFALQLADRYLPMAAIRHLIRTQWPDCIEDMQYGIPTYHLRGQALFVIASQKNHIAFYLVPKEMMNTFKNDLRTRDCGKSCIRFKTIRPEDMELLERIVKFVGTTFTGHAPKLRGFANLR